jgi:DNA-binding phage protein
VAAGFAEADVEVVDCPDAEAFLALRPSEAEEAEELKSARRKAARARGLVKLATAAGLTAEEAEAVMEALR